MAKTPRSSRWAGFSGWGFSLARRPAAAIAPPVMTRQSIEFATKVFLVLLIIAFAWSFYLLMKQMGLL
jgi:hypothetical protein